MKGDLGSLHHSVKHFRHRQDPALASKSDLGSPCNWQKLIFCMCIFPCDCHDRLISTLCHTIGKCISHHMLMYEYRLMNTL